VQSQALPGFGKHPEYVLFNQVPTGGRGKGNVEMNKSGYMSMDFQNFHGVSGIYHYDIFSRLKTYLIQPIFGLLTVNLLII
jgi:hypothetical protein